MNTLSSLVSLIYIKTNSYILRFIHATATCNPRGFGLATSCWIGLGCCTTSYIAKLPTCNIKHQVSHTRSKMLKWKLHGCFGILNHLALQQQLWHPMKLLHCVKCVLQLGCSCLYEEPSLLQLVSF